MTPCWEAIIQKHHELLRVEMQIRSGHPNLKVVAACELPMLVRLGLNRCYSWDSLPDSMAMVKGRDWNPKRSKQQPSSFVFEVSMTSVIGGLNLDELNEKNVSTAKKSCIKFRTIQLYRVLMGHILTERAQIYKKYILWNQKKCIFICAILFRGNPGVYR